MCGWIAIDNSVYDAAWHCIAKLRWLKLETFLSHGAIVSLVNIVIMCDYLHDYILTYWSDFYIEEGSVIAHIKMNLYSV